MAKYNIPMSIKKTNEGKKYYSPGLLENYIPSQTDFTYVAQSNDRWDLLAHRFYGDAQFWYILAKVNGRFNGSIFITPGRLLIIPQIL